MIRGRNRVEWWALMFTEPRAVASGIRFRVSFTRPSSDQSSHYPARNHHPTPAARVGTPVRSRFCISLSFRSKTGRAGVAEVKRVVFEVGRLHLQRQVIYAETIM